MFGVVDIKFQIFCNVEGFRFFDVGINRSSEDVLCVIQVDGSGYVVGLGFSG